MQDENGWRYRYTDGTYATGKNQTSENGTVTEYVSWVKIGGYWYAFDANGYMMVEWVYDAEVNEWYYCDKTQGYMVHGWLLCPDDGYTYYLDLNDGVMYRGWHTIDGKRYFFSPDRCGSYYFNEATEKWIYYNPNHVRPLGSMYVNELTPDGTYVNAQGAAEN